MFGYGYRLNIASQMTHKWHTSLLLDFKGITKGLETEFYWVHIVYKTGLKNEGRGPHAALNSLGHGPETTGCETPFPCLERYK